MQLVNYVVFRIISLAPSFLLSLVVVYLIEPGNVYITCKYSCLLLLSTTYIILLKLFAVLSLFT